MKHILFLLLSLFILRLSAQERTIQGQVVDEDNNPIQATIIVPSSEKSTLTDEQGNFSIILDEKDTDIEINSANKIPEIIHITSQVFYNVTLRQNADINSTVIITSSYGTKKLKEEVVGSIIQLDAKDLITEQAAISVEDLLEGQAAGVQISSSNQLGVNSQINIRGLGSLSNNSVGTSTQPLIIVDGVQLQEDLLINENNFFDSGTGDSSELLLTPLAKLGIENIQTINILKDAAAVSLYGANGANGVILITTKKGQKGPLRVDFSSQYGISQAINKIKWMNGEQYQSLLNEYYTNSGNLAAVTPWNGVNTDWYDLLNRTGSFSRNMIALSGGSKYWNYRGSVSFQKTDETQIKNNFRKTTGDFGIGYSRDKWSIGINLAPSYTKKNSPNNFYNLAVPPTISPYNADGSYSSFSVYGNPLAVAHQNKDEDITKGLLSNINASFKPIEGLTLSGFFGVDLSNKDSDTFKSGENNSGINSAGDLGYRILRTRKNRGWRMNTKAYYEKQLTDKNYFDVLVGFEAVSNKADLTYETGRGFAIYSEPRPISEAEKQSGLIDDSTEQNTVSWFSQINYNFMKKYFVLVNFRADQSSSFGSDNKTALNGGLGLSWVINKENFLKDIRWLTDLRLRTSIGLTGNSRIGSYAAQGLYNLQTSGGGYNATPENNSSYATPSTAPNPNLGWEKNRMFNVGIDVGINKRWNATLEFYDNQLSDMIVSRALIPESGYSTIQINGAEMYNRGVEFSFDYNVLQLKNLFWKTGFNIAHNKNKITELLNVSSAESITNSAYYQQVGNSTSDIQGWNHVGIDPATGLDLYNVKGNIVNAIDIENQFNYTDRSIIGNTQPDFYGGWNNQFTLMKDFNLRINFTYSYGADVLLNSNIIDKYTDLIVLNLPVNVYNSHWSNQGDQVVYPKPASGINPISQSSKYLFDTSNITLNNISLTYNLPTRKMEIPFKRLSINANISNVYTWYKEGSPSGENGIAELQSQYPAMRNYTFGISGTF